MKSDGLRKVTEFEIIIVAYHQKKWSFFKISVLKTSLTRRQSQTWARRYNMRVAEEIGFGWTKKRVEMLYKRSWPSWALPLMHTTTGHRRLLLLYSAGWTNVRFFWWAPVWQPTVGWCFRYLFAFGHRENWRGHKVQFAFRLRITQKPFDGQFDLKVDSQVDRREFGIGTWTTVLVYLHSAGCLLLVTHNWS